MRANTPHYGTRDYHFIHYIAELKKKNTILMYVLKLFL